MENARKCPLYQYWISGSLMYALLVRSSTKAASRGARSLTDLLVVFPRGPLVLHLFSTMSAALRCACHIGLSTTSPQSYVELSIVVPETSTEGNVLGGVSVTPPLTESMRGPAAALGYVGRLYSVAKIS
ncbi:hypothetical protein VTO73DRAFT_6240 [Trametes versicolor]